MKKILALILAVVMLLSLTGCAEVLDILLDIGIGYLETMDPTDGTTVPGQPVVTDPEDPTQKPTVAPTQKPTEAPTEPPTEAPTQKPTEAPTEPPTEAPTEPPIDEKGWYYSKEDVALYLYTYGHLPSNFITKSQAQSLGWSGGSVERYKAGAAIGGDRFSNREGLLPKASGRQYYECDIDTNGRNSRGAKRIVFSNDGLIYYTDNHYESFTLLYGGE
jgi:hypothetical protein